MPQLCFAQFYHQNRHLLQPFPTQFRCKPCSAVGESTALLQSRCGWWCWMRPSKPHASCDPPWSSHCGLLWIPGAGQVGEAPAPALLLLPQPVSDDVFSCLSVTYRDAGQSSLLWHLPEGAPIPAPHAREAAEALPKASSSSAAADKREPGPSCLRWKGKELSVDASPSPLHLHLILQGLTAAAPQDSW